MSRTPAPLALLCKFSAISILAVLFSTSVLAAQEEVLYPFQGGTDGYGPSSSLLLGKDGNFYGTTDEGGNGQRCGGNSYPQGCGTVFKLTPPSQSGGSWSETVLYRFQGGNDGYAPALPVVADAQGNLYSTTVGGGHFNNGTVFELKKPSTSSGSWTHHILYNFEGVVGGKGSGDGALPGPIVFDAAGNIYGTTDGGGLCINYQGLVNCFGTVFKLAPPSSSGGQWTESVLYRFGMSGYANPHGGVIVDKNGNLYGTTYIGGTGFGGVFELSPSGSSWTEKTLFNFDNSDGGVSNGALVFDSVGNLYGTTLQGGPANAGTVFELSPPATSGGAWTETVLHDFLSGSDGNAPLANVVLDQAGNVYGTTWQGGNENRGIVFQLAPPVPPNTTWTETILHSFGSGADGREPTGGLIFGSDGALYGTTQNGGSTTDSNSCLLDSYAFTCGTVFRIVP